MSVSAEVDGQVVAGAVVTIPTGVIEAALLAREDIGAEITRINAAIGPTISQRAYEVGQDFFEAFFDAYQFRGPERFPADALLPGRT